MFEIKRKKKTLKIGLLRTPPTSGGGETDPKDEITITSMNSNSEQVKNIQNRGYYRHSYSNLTVGHLSLQEVLLSFVCIFFSFFFFLFPLTFSLLPSPQEFNFVSMKAPVPHTR